MVQVPGVVSAIVEQIRARIADIEEQLRRHRDLSEELERLRDALARLEGGVRARVPRTRTPAKASSPETTGAVKRPTSAKRSAAAKPSTSANKSAAAKRSASAKVAGAERTPPRPASPSARGQTRATVLEALKDGPKTAGDIAEATGLNRGSVATTLSKLANSGDVVKAERGYRLPDEPV